MMAKRDAESGREGLGQMPWLPASTEEQLKLGLELINYAFLTRGNAMQREESSLAARVQELNNKLREAEDRTADCELEIQDLRSKYTQATEENRVMAGTIRKLKIENARLEDIKNNIKSTIDMSVSPHISDPLGSPRTHDTTGPAHE
jgi:chromosome segregation ATPase